ncbi:MAG TPA: dienelactone hydrolase family protein [Elusimicrobiota bacterium]|nr:dienelactone hydrolase family protein [Elusimicrobiota bacterium]
MGTELDFALHGSVATVYEAIPDPGTLPAIIVLHGRWGFEPYVARFCDQLAAEGFAVQAPDLYYGKIARTTQEADDLTMAMNLPQVDQEIYACLSSLTDHIKTSRKKVGLVGFGMGGRLARVAALRFPPIAACIDFYGLHPKRMADPGFPCPLLEIRADFEQMRIPGSRHAGIGAGAWLEMVDFLRHHLRTERAHTVRGIEAVLGGRK